MKKLILGLAVAAATLTAGAAMAQSYGYAPDRSAYGDRYDYRSGYYDRYERPVALRDRDRDGIPDRAEWGRDRDHDGRPDQWDRYDNRRDHYGRHHFHHDRNSRWDRDYRDYDYRR